MVPHAPHLLHRTSKLLAALSLVWVQSLVACDVGEASSGTGGTSAIGGGPPSPGGSSTAGAPSGGGGASSALGGAGGLGGSAGGMPAGGLGGSAGSMPAGGSGGSAPGTFRVEAGKLYDRCSEQVVLRGVNEMIVWSPGRDGVPEFAEIAKTGANAVRIVWNEEGNAAGLDVAITNALAQQLIPMIEHHGATGDLTKLAAVVDYWVQPDIVAVVKKHEQNLLLNIANEAGDGMVTAASFQAAYQPAITRLREVGLVLPLVIDAPSWGQNIDVLQATWQPLTMHDPRHNLLFSVHMWWSDPSGTRVKAELAESVAAGMPLVVGEFAQHAVSGCKDQPFAYGVLLEEAQRSGIGWLAWSWGSVPNSDCKDAGAFDMTIDGVYGSWKETWGEDVAVTHPASIQKTSVRPASIVSGACR
jgi:mannan endo-1,4-beta-mannosidase